MKHSVYLRRVPVCLVCHDVAFKAREGRMELAQFPLQKKDVSAVFLRGPSEKVALAFVPRHTIPPSA